MKKLKLLKTILKSCGHISASHDVSELIKKYSGKAISFASNILYQDDEGRFFVIVELSDGSNKLFYKSTGSNTPGLNSPGAWLPMNGITLDSGGEVWYIKDPDKIPAKDTELYDIMQTLTSGEQMKTPTNLQSVNTFMKKFPKTETERMENNNIFSQIAKFNNWAKQHHAIPDIASSSKYNTPGINFTFRDAILKFPGMFSED